MGIARKGNALAAKGRHVEHLADEGFERGGGRLKVEAEMVRDGEEPRGELPH